MSILVTGPNGHFDKSDIFPSEMVHSHVNVSYPIGNRNVFILHAEDRKSLTPVIEIAHAFICENEGSELFNVSDFRNRFKEDAEKCLSGF